MKRIFILLITLIFISCDPVLLFNQSEEYIKEFQRILKGYSSDDLKSPVKVAAQLSTPIKTEEGVSYYKDPVTINFTSEGEGVTIEAKLNGVVQTSNSITVSEDGVYYLLVKATDKLGRTAYCGEKFFVDSQLPVIKFVNTADSCILANINNFQDSVPDNAMEDSSSGVDTSTLKGWWKNDVVPNSVGVWTRCYTVCDNLGNESAVFEHPVKVADLFRGDYMLTFVMGYEFDSNPSGDGIVSSISSGLSFSTPGFMTFAGDAADQDFEVDAAKMPLFDYAEISVKWDKDSYQPNYYVNNKALGASMGFVFLKQNASPTTAFLVGGSWQTSSGACGCTPSIKENGEENIIGFLELSSGGLAYCNGDAKEEQFARDATLRNGGNGNIRFGFNADGKVSGMTVYVDYIRFYKAVLE